MFCFPLGFVIKLRRWKHSFCSPASDFSAASTHPLQTGWTTCWLPMGVQIRVCCFHPHAPPLQYPWSWEGQGAGSPKGDPAHAPSVVTLPGRCRVGFARYRGSRQGTLASPQVSRHHSHPEPFVAHMFVYDTFPEVSPHCLHKTLIDSGVAGNFIEIIHP